MSGPLHRNPPIRSRRRRVLATAGWTLIWAVIVGCLYLFARHGIQAW